MGCNLHGAGTEWVTGLGSLLSNWGKEPLSIACNALILLVALFLGGMKHIRRELTGGDEERCCAQAFVLILIGNIGFFIHCV